MERLKNKDIAKALNISTAAVSMALNNKPGVSDETRKRVIDYYLNHADSESSPILNALQQQTLIMDIHKTRGDIIIEKPFFSKLITAIELEARKEGYSLTIVHYDSSMDLPKYVSSLNDQNAAGVLILATELTEEALLCYQKLRAPFVLLDGYIDLMPADSVTLDNQTAIFRAYDYAYSMGHRNIGYLKCSTAIPNFRHRFNGFMIGRQTYEPGLTTPPIVFSLPGNMEKAQQAMAQQLRSLPKSFQMPSCFLCDLDFIAIGAMSAFQEKGYRIPDDISLVGFDDIDYAAIVRPSLTTIHLHESALGREAVKLLQNRITNQEFCCRNIRLMNELVIRNSVKNLNGHKE